MARHGGRRRIEGDVEVDTDRVKRLRLNLSGPKGDYQVMANDEYVGQVPEAVVTEIINRATLESEGDLLHGNSRSTGQREAYESATT